MEWVAAIVLLALIEFLVFALMVVGARRKFGIAAPAITGNEVFERYFRVQQNTLEQLIVFIPSIWCFGRYISPYWAAALGSIFIVGRIVYAAGYIKDPKSRTLGYALSAIPMFILLGGGLLGALRAILIMS